MRMLRSCTVHWLIRGRTRLGHRVSREGGAPKGGVSGPAEDLRPVPEVEAGVNFRQAGRVRGQVAGSLPGSVVTPSLHPEVPDSLFVSPGPGKRIRHLMGWTKVCGNHTIGDLGAKG